VSRSGIEHGGKFNGAVPASRLLSPTQSEHFHAGVLLCSSGAIQTPRSIIHPRDQSQFQSARGRRGHFSRMPVKLIRREFRFLC
jgi:hypothetical protein